MMHKRNRESGFSMVEVIIASVLLSVIIVATFTLVTQGVRRAYSAKQMTRATILAQAIQERANIVAPHVNLGGTGATNTALTYTFTSASGTLGPSATPAGDTTAAQNERTKWRTIVANSELPSPTVVVTITPLPSGRTFDASAVCRIVVDVSWSEVFGGANINTSRPRSVRLQTFNVRSAS